MFPEEKFQALKGKAWVLDAPLNLSREASLIWGLSNELATYVEMTCDFEHLLDIDRDCHAQLFWAEVYLCERRIPRPEAVCRVIAVSTPARKGRPRIV